MIRRPPRSTLSSSSAASDVYKRQEVIVLIQHVRVKPRKVSCDTSAPVSLQQPLRQRIVGPGDTHAGGKQALVGVDALADLHEIVHAQRAAGHSGYELPHLGEVQASVDGKLAEFEAVEQTHQVLCSLDHGNLA